MSIKLVPVDPEPVDSQSSSNDIVKEVGGLKWQQMRQLGMALYPTASPYGKPTVFYCATRFIAIGTYSAEVLLFNYSQQLMAHLSTAGLTLKSSVGSMLGPLTSLNVDADESHLIAGFALGWVVVWDLEAPPHNKPQIVTAIPPLSPDNVPHGNSVIQRHETHVHGVPVTHCCFISRPLKGKYKLLSLDASGIIIKHQHKRLMLDKVTISKRILGSYQQPVQVLSVDSSAKWNLLAILTVDLVLVVDISESTSNHPPVVLSVPRAKDTAVDPQGYGCVRFNQRSRQLVYSWGNQLKHITFDESHQFAVASAYNHVVPITQLDWIGEQLVVLASKDNFSLVELGNQQIIDSDTQSMSPASNCLQVSAMEHSVFVLGKYEFSVGQFTNWADRLLGLLNAEKPVEAVKLALHYLRDDGDLAVLGLPIDKTQKDKAIVSTLPDLIMTALQFGLEFDEDSLYKLLPEAVNATVIAEIPLLEPIMEAIENNKSALDTFFQAILRLVQQRVIYELPPSLFRALVARHPEPKLFYNLSLTTLDLDLAFKMCSQYPNALEDVKIYLENQALNDYLSPLQRPGDELSPKCYEYLTLILTSRVFPTGEDMEPERALLAKQQIYTALFIGGSRELLTRLLENNESAMLDALNMGFQDTWLNEENAEINRQIIVNVLLKNCKGSLNNKLSVPLSVFLARNYPKYHQFIVLNDTVLADLVNALCGFRPPPSQPDTTEEQLSLLSLLSVYKVHNNSEFVQKLIAAKYMLVLEHVFRQQHKLLDLANVQLEVGEDPFNTLTESLVKNFKEAVLFIEVNFDRLLSADPRKLGKLAARFNLQGLWGKSTSSLPFMDSAFEELHSRGGSLPSPDICTEYVTQLAKQDKGPRIMWVLQTVLTGEDDVILPLVVDTLIEEKRIDVLALFLRRKGRNSEAMIYIVNYLPETRSPEELSMYVDLACSICQDVSKTDRHEGIQVCQRLIEALVDLPSASEELQRVIKMLAESDVSDVVQMVKYLLDYATTDDQSTETVSAEGSPTKGSPTKGSPTKAGKPNKMAIANSLHTHITRRERALRCFLQLVQTDGYQDLMKMLEGRARGWVIPVDGECEVCGRKIVGLGIDAARLYKYWEQAQTRGRHQADEVQGDQVQDQGQVADGTLVLFQCKHSYHYTCLRRMTGQRQCVICNP